MNKLRNFLEIRENARRMGDSGLQRAMDQEMRRMGYAAPETTQALVMEMAIPEKPRRGRPPKRKEASVGGEREGDERGKEKERKEREKKEK